MLLQDLDSQTYFYETLSFIEFAQEIIYLFNDARSTDMNIKSKLVRKISSFFSLAAKKDLVSFISF